MTSIGLRFAIGMAWAPVLGVLANRRRPAIIELGGVPLDVTPHVRRSAA